MFGHSDLKKLPLFSIDYDTVDCRNLKFEIGKFFFQKNKKIMIYKKTKLNNLGLNNDGIYRGYFDENKTFPIAVKKISFKNENLESADCNENNLDHPINNENRIIDYLSKNLNLKNICSHFPLYYKSIYNPYKKTIYIYYELYGIFCYGQNCCSLDGFMDYTFFGELKNSIIIIFQILYTLACLEKLQISHNDMNLRNILVRTIIENNDIFFQYIINNQKYYIPSIGIITKLADYGLSWSPKFRNKLIENLEYKHIGIYPEFVVGKDTLQLLNNIYYYYNSFNQPIIKKFIERNVDRTFLYTSENSPYFKYGHCTILNGLEHLLKSPIEILNDEIFKPYLNKNVPSNNIIETYNYDNFN